jgi:hypothetical protein
MERDIPAQPSESKAIVENVVAGFRAALAEYEATPRLERYRRSAKRLTAIKEHRRRV